MNRSWLPLVLVLLALMGAKVRAVIPPSYNIPSVSTFTSTPDNNNEVPFVITLSRALTSSESIRLDFGRQLDLSNFNAIDPSTTGCLNDGKALSFSSVPTPTVTPTSQVITTLYDIATLLRAYPGSIITTGGLSGCNFAISASPPAGYASAVGRVMVWFYSVDGIVAPIFKGTITLLIPNVLTSNTATLSVNIVTVVEGSTSINPQQLNGVLYRVPTGLVVPVAPSSQYDVVSPGPPVSITNAYPPSPLGTLTAQLSSFYAVTFQVTSDLPLLYWLSDVKLYLCLNGVTAPGTNFGTSTATCITINGYHFTGLSSTTFPLTTPITVGTSSGTSFGLDAFPVATAVPYNNLISFWVAIPTSSGLTIGCPITPNLAATLMPSPCTLQAIIKLTLDPSSVTNSLSVPAHLQLMSSDGKFRTMDTTTSTETEILATSDFHLSEEASAASFTSASTPLLAMLAFAVMTLVGRA